MHILTVIWSKLAHNTYIDAIYRIKLISLKNINIWPSYRPKLTSETRICPYMGIRFSAITLPFLINQAEILYYYSRDHYLSITHLKFCQGHFLKNAPILGGKWAWPPRRRHMVFGLQTQPKSWLTGYTFWVNHYLEIVFSKISVVNPPPPPPPP